MHPRTHGLRARVATVLAVAAVGSLVVTHASNDAAPSVDGFQLAPSSALQRVELPRRKVAVVGDGRTVYVANRTSFRPRKARVTLPPQVRANAWAVVDLDTGRLLGKYDARAQLPQASTMKLLTAVTATRHIDQAAKHRVTKYEAGQTCSCAGLRPGLRYSRDTLLAGMLLPSGNDAAEAVAGSHPDGRQAFYRAMNDVAAELGASDTVAANASGLTAYGSHSSARDLVLLLRAALADPTVTSILSMRSATIASVRGLRAHTVWRGTDYVNMYPGSLGKSGYTTPAQNTLVVATEIDGHRIAVSSLGAPGGYSTSGARALTLWATKNFENLRAVGRLPNP
jgi:serine-type D-Ala-D-Ala carboxypeptidase (penicillin-binding protein 5/6)